MILECEIIEASDKDNEKSINEKIEKALKYDLVILRNFLPHFNINENLFKLEYLSSKTETDFKNYKIDIVEQIPNFYGFMNNKQIKMEWNLNDYLEYVKKKSRFFQGTVKNLFEG